MQLISATWIILNDEILLSKEENKSMKQTNWTSVDIFIRLNISPACCLLAKYIEKKVYKFWTLFIIQGEYTRSVLSRYVQYV